ncbi:MAG: hypothetical protein AVDCRST_MAG74-1744 [uncultured Pyrinomonadaceae bacterium]|uniref:Uncharacterized protein n=1 Tax=uncultured Pyrinomonadaceae bacterium TaxID=2283094 RepID=A0A6J4P0F4_9BACT|nr:MAG: hypothetical protein AVDCRST_MAG74-1744 [uncultured Pyrinomonadaceae bacterium]
MTNAPTYRSVFSLSNQVLMNECSARALGHVSDFLLDGIE